MRRVEFAVGLFLAVLVSGVLAEPSQCLPLAPARLRIRIHSVVWGSGLFASSKTEATDYFDAITGDDIDGNRAYPGWTYFGTGGPFKLGKIEDSEHAWVHFSSDIRPARATTGDSVLISTVDRTFASDSYDAGIWFTLRIEPRNPYSAGGTMQGAQVVRRGQVPRGSGELQDRVEASEVVGSFRILNIRAGADSVPMGQRKLGTTEIKVVPLDLWLPGSVTSKDTLRVLQVGSATADSEWTPMPRATPMRSGACVILFLEKGTSAPFAGRWSFSAGDGYGFVAEPERLAFTHFGRGVPLVRFRNQILTSERIGYRAGRGALVGRVVRAGTGTPIPGATLRVEGRGTPTTSETDGGFVLFDLLIGQAKLVATDSHGDVSVPVEISDEKTDSLELRIAEPDDADPEPQSPDSVLANARAKLRSGEFHHLSPYDVPPMPYRRFEPGYPRDAWASEYQGDVGVRVRVDSVGMCTNVFAQGQVPASILRAAETCVRGWKFRPALKDGRPVGASLTVAVHFAHPASGNLGSAADCTANAVAAFTDSLGPTKVKLGVEGSVTLDSVTHVYRYYYRVKNISGSTRNLVSFALMPVAPLPDAFAHPTGWNGFEEDCADRRHVIGWYPSGENGDWSHAVDCAVEPGKDLVGIGFESISPPGRVRWFAITLRPGERGEFTWDCDETRLGTPLQGTIVGPSTIPGTGLGRKP